MIQTRCCCGSVSDPPAGGTASNGTGGDAYGGYADIYASDGGTLNGGALTVTANYTWTQTRNDAPTSPNFGKTLPRRPAHQANGEVSYKWPSDIETAVAVRFNGDMFDDAANRFRLKGVTLVDLRANWPIVEHIELYGRVENLFDRHYQNIRNYAQPGRSAYAGVRARF